PEIQQRTVLCTAPSKTFNLAGLQVSNIFIADDELRRKFLDEINRCGYSQANALGLTACRAAYEGGLPWVRELRAYLAGNFKLIRETLASALPTVTLIEPQGTYLAWLDFNATALTHDEINRRMLSAAKLWLDEGTMFGPEGSGFMRINTACPRSVIADAMERIVRAFR
ncbi:MAG: aminotransferase, partial [Oscillospiraceae bacterium]|nr:aminotransferase [Oscillospiraceae bacterium]